MASFATQHKENHCHDMIGFLTPSFLPQAGRACPTPRLDADGGQTDAQTASRRKQPVDGDPSPAHPRILLSLAGEAGQLPSSGVGRFMEDRYKHQVRVSPYLDRCSADSSLGGAGTHFHMRCRRVDDDAPRMGFRSNSSGWVRSIPATMPRRGHRAIRAWRDTSITLCGEAPRRGLFPPGPNVTI